MDKGPVRVLLIEDDPDDHLLTKELVGEIPGNEITLDWAPDFEAGLQSLRRCEHDAVLLDYRLGKRDGIGLLREALREGCRAPIILLTGQGDRDLALQALEAGAADYLVKGELSAVVLERSIRYALAQRRQALELEQKVVERTAELQRANAAQRESEEYLRLLLDSTEQGFYGIDQEARTTICNAAFLRLLGYESAQEVIGRKLHEIIHHSHPDGSHYPVEDCPIYRAALKGEAAHVTDEMFFPVKGAPFPVEYYSHPVIRDGELRGAITTFTDISERKRAERSLLNIQAQLKSAIAAGAVGTWNWDLEADVLTANSALAHTFGLDPDKVHRGLPAAAYFESIVPEDRANVEAAISEAINSTGVYAIEHRVCNSEGEIRSVIARGAVEYDAAGKAIRLPGALTDITERREAEEAAREAGERFRFLAESLPQKIFTATPTGEIDYFNREWMGFTGLSFARIRDWGWVQFIHPEDVEENIRRWQHSIDTQEPFNIEHRFLRLDGQYRWHLSRAYPMRDSEGRVTMWIGSNTDIEDQKRHEDKLRASESRARALFESAEAARVSAEAAKSRAENATRAKDDFLAALSHELRTPLNPALLLATSLAEDPSLPAHIRHDIDVISKGIALQAELVDDLLDITRITGGKLRLELRPIDAHIILRNAYQIVRPDLEARELTAVFDLAAQHNCIEADAVRLQQIFWNVLKNAVKFTEPGGSIQVRTSNPAEKPNILRVEVTDTGIGIASENIGSVFDAFVQEEHDRGHRFGGIGLGLAITRRLVELQRGRIEAQSEGRGHGATFRMEFPLEPVELCKEAPPTPVVPAPGVPSARRILLVEDHEQTRLTLVQLLERRGHAVTAVASIAAAKEAAAAGVFDLVISDLGLPDGDGYELMAELSTALRLPGIALSGYGMDDDIARSRASGFFLHLTKPVDIRSLDSAIASAPRPAFA